MIASGSRLMFPIYNVMGRVVALGGRLLDNLPEAPKYLNSPETTIYKKAHAMASISPNRRSEPKAGCSSSRATSI